MEENTYLCNGNTNYEEIMDFKETFKRYGLNATSMAEKMGLSQQNLQAQISRGTINIKQLEEMAHICGVSLGEFVGADMPSEIKISANGKDYIYKLKL